MYNVEEYQRLCGGGGKQVYSDSYARFTHKSQLSAKQEILKFVCVTFKVLFQGKWGYSSHGGSNAHMK